MQRKLIEGAVSPLILFKKRKDIYSVVSCYDREPKNEKCSYRFIGGELDYDTKVSN